MGRLPDHQPPEILEFFRGVALDPRNALEDAPAINGVWEVGFPFLPPPFRFEEEDWEDDWEEDSEDDSEEDSEEDLEEDSEEDSDSDEDTDVESEEDDQRFPPEEFWAGWRLGAFLVQAVEEVVRPASPFPQQRAESPSPSPSPITEEEPRPSSSAVIPPAPSSTPASCHPPVGPALDFLPLGGSKRPRDEDEDEDPISKRPCLSSSEDSPQDPSPSTSAGTSGFRRYFHHHLLQDPESDDD